MVVLENLRIALAALRANGLRSLLTTLGIIIGVAAVVAVVSVVQGLQHLATDVFEGVGATFLHVEVNQDRQHGPGLIAKQVKLTAEDAQAVRQLFLAQLEAGAQLAQMLSGIAGVCLGRLAIHSARVGQLIRSGPSCRPAAGWWASTWGPRPSALVCLTSSVVSPRLCGR